MIFCLNSPFTVHAQDRELRYMWVFNTDRDFAPDSVLGKRDEDFLTEENAIDLTEFKKGIINRGVGRRKEFSFDLPSAAVAYDITCDPMRDSQGTIVGTTEAGINITERKQLEARFQQAQKMEAVCILAGGTAHNFKI